MADDPVNLAAVLALQPLADKYAEIDPKATDDTVVMVPFTVADIKQAQMSYTDGVAYKYADRDKMINACVAIVGNLDGITDPGERQRRRDMVAAIEALRPVYVK